MSDATLWKGLEHPWVLWYPRESVREKRRALQTAPKDHPRVWGQRERREPGRKIKDSPVRRGDHDDEEGRLAGKG